MGDWFELSRAWTVGAYRRLRLQTSRLHATGIGVSKERECLRGNPTSISTNPSWAAEGESRVVPGWLSTEREPSAEADTTTPTVTQAWVGNSSVWFERARTLLFSVLRWIQFYALTSTNGVQGLSEISQGTNVRQDSVHHANGVYRSRSAEQSSDHLVPHSGHRPLMFPVRSKRHDRQHGRESCIVLRDRARTFAAIARTIAATITITTQTKAPNISLNTSSKLSGDNHSSTPRATPATSADRSATKQSTKTPTIDAMTMSQMYLEVLDFESGDGPSGGLIWAIITFILQNERRYLYNLTTSGQSVGKQKTGQEPPGYGRAHYC
jgi:hypothetical protein